MLVGADFDKIEWVWNGFVLLEPNAFIGDTIIAFVAFYFFFKTRRFVDSGRLFFKNWNVFFIVFGLGFFGGGLGHLLFHYWGIYGKFFAWFAGIPASYFLETAMISLMKHHRSFYLRLAGIKAVLAFVGLIIIILFVDLGQEPLKGLIIPTVNSFIGLVFALGYLGSRFLEQYGSHFKYVLISILVMLPTIPFQAFKINFHQWFDRNDVSHVVIIAGLILYYKTVSFHHKRLDKAQTA